MLLLCSLAACLVAMIMTRPVASFQRPLAASRRFGWRMSASESDAAAPTTFREAEVLGLKLMQEGDYDLALKGTCGSFDNNLVGWFQRPFDSTHSFRSFHHLYTAFQTGLKLPGSRSDVVRTKSLSGPSPVGGAMGGFESNAVQSLDEFEMQAAHYNMACAYAQLGQLPESIQSLETAFKAGFDNYATVRGDPDLDPIKKEKDFEALMEKYEPKKGFNPFGLFGGK